MLALGQLAEEIAVLESQLAAAELAHRERQADMVKQRNRARMIKVRRDPRRCLHALPPTTLAAPIVRQLCASCAPVVRLPTVCKSNLGARGAGARCWRLCPH